MPSPHSPHQAPAPGSPGTSRRSFVGALGAGVLGAAALGAIPAAHAAPAPVARRGALALNNAYLGTYGNGIITCTYDTDTGELTETGSFDDVTNPDFLALSPSGDVLYSVDSGGSEGGVRAFTIGEDGSLTPLGDVQSTGGQGVTHLSVHPSGSHVLSANYSSGSVAAHPIEEDGSVGELSGFVQHTGSGPDPDRQEGPHAHQIITDPAGAYVFAVDLGTDSVYTYALDPDSGELQPVSEAKSEPGAGPRHMVFHPEAPYAYVLNELDSTVTAYAYDPDTGELTRGESWSSVPDDADQDANDPAEITISADGRFVYLSNRGHDSVAWFATEDDGATLTLVDTVSCGGSWPRHISLSPSGGLLFSANERASNVGVFTVDTETGALTPAGTPFDTSALGCVLPS